MKLKLKKRIELSKILEKIEVDNDSDQTTKKLDSYHQSPKAHVIGITGPPGVGKSSMINNLIKTIRGKKKSVGVIAIDPSSNESGGALLGDRTRFSVDPNDDDVFVRSMATKNYLGGVSELTYPTMIVMRSLFDYLIVETVGVGQSETNIKYIVDTVILCVQPGSGDTIQFMKSGVFEIPDILVITKCDIDKLPELTYSELSASKQYFNKNDSWNINLHMISSHKNIGFEKLWININERWEWLQRSRFIKEIRINQDMQWIKNNILNDFGKKGLDKLKKKFVFNKNPFSTLKTLKKKI